MFPYPHPKSIGLIMDPATLATVKSVESGSIAERFGIQAGDKIKSIEGQPILSIADLQWVLHSVPAAGGNAQVRIDRGGNTVYLTLLFQGGWRTAGDISWRVSTWSLRRMVTGGLVLSQPTDQQRSEWNLDEASMALVVTHVGQYNEHAAAKRAGFRKGDVIVSYDGRDDLESEAALMHHAVTRHRPGDQVAVGVLRRGVRKELRLPIQP